MKEIVITYNNIRKLFLIRLVKMRRSLIVLHMYYYSICPANTFCRLKSNPYVTRTHKFQNYLIDLCLDYHYNDNRFQGILQMIGKKCMVI